LKVDKKSLLLYAVTDRMWLKGRSLASQVEDAIRGGVTFVQLREKNIDVYEYVALARDVKKVTDKYRIPFVINDDVDVALAARADGVHVGQSDMGVRDARQRIGEGMILGASVQTVEQALQAQEQGADYLGVGAIFTTSTKLDADNVSLETLKAICSAVTIPVVAIGGIHKDNISMLKGTGVAGIAVVSALFAQKDIFAAAHELFALTQRMVTP